MGCICGWLVVIQKPSIEPLWLVAFVAKSAFVAECTQVLACALELCAQQSFVLNRAGGM